MCEIKLKEKKKKLDKFPLHRTENSQKAFSCKLKGYDSPKFVENVWNLKTARDQLAAVEWRNGSTEMFRTKSVTKRMKLYLVFSPVMIDKFTMKQNIRITKRTIKFIVVFGRWTRMFCYFWNAFKTCLHFPNKWFLMASLATLSIRLYCGDRFLRPCLCLQIQHLALLWWVRACSKLRRIGDVPDHHPPDCQRFRADWFCFRCCWRLTCRGFLFRRGRLNGPNLPIELRRIRFRNWGCPAPGRLSWGSTTKLPALSLAKSSGSKDRWANGGIRSRTWRWDRLYRVFADGAASYSSTRLCKRSESKWPTRFRRSFRHSGLRIPFRLQANNQDKSAIFVSWFKVNLRAKLFWQQLVTHVSY